MTLKSEGDDVDFSEIFKQSGGNAAWSPDGLWLAIGNSHRLCIRDTISMEISQIYSCVDNISSIEWSPDSMYVLTSISKQKVVQIWSVGDKDWTCKISEGLSGLSTARWCPDSRHLMTFSEFNLHITVWSLVDKSASYIKRPKSSQHGVDFSSDAMYAAIALRHEYKDYIGIYETATWEQVEFFKTDTQDLVEIKWSPDNSCIAVRDTSLNYNLAVYRPTGELVTKYVAYEHALGIKCMNWSSKGDILAVGSYDGKLRLLNAMTWRPIFQFTHKSSIHNTDDVEIYEEVFTEEAVARDNNNNIIKENKSMNESSLLSSSLFDTSKDINYRNGQHRSSLTETCYFSPKPSHTPIVILQVVKPLLPTNKSKAISKGPPKFGISECQWSLGDQFIATRCSNMPYSVFIWNVHALKLHCVLTQKHILTSIAWDPDTVRLTICCGTGKTYYWTINSVSWVDVPFPAFHVRGVRWNPQGHAATLLSKDRLCVTYLSGGTTSCSSSNESAVEVNDE